LFQGEQLETIDRQRLRASESKQLIEYFMAFNRGDMARVESLKKKEGQLKVKGIIRTVVFFVFTYKRAFQTKWMSQYETQ